MTISAISVTLPTASEQPTRTTVRLDESRLPFASVTLTFPLTDYVLSITDPRETPTITVDIEQVFTDSRPINRLNAATLSVLSSVWSGAKLFDISATYASQWQTADPGPPRLRRFNLQVRARSIRYKEAEVEVTLASGEQSLVDYALMATGPVMAGPTVADAARLALGMAVPGALLDVPAYESPETAQGREITAADARVWEPGVTAWDWLTGIIAAHGYRVWCDEAGIWHLHKAEGIIAYPEALLGTIENVTSLTEDIDIDSSEWASSVIVVYRWTDSAGTRQVRYDVAGVGGKVARFERETAYPGPGEAAWRLWNLERKARTASVQAVLDPLLSPSAHAVLNTTTTGYEAWISSVEFSVPGDVATIKLREVTEV